MTSESGRGQRAADPEIRVVAPRGSISGRPRRRLIIRAGIRPWRACVEAWRPRIGSNRLGSGLVISVHLRPGLRAHGLAFLQHNNMRPNRSAIVEVDDVVIEQANAAARHLLADRLRLDRSVEAKIGVLIAAVEIKRARPE